ncbi:hypothetical protein BKA66DRAFT_463373 [Pyrenochaeta sp. MPI-SDFR-AT-0127]|nr:hypothetical protein BKA66DRAFT_463373 [Pyrenochaeta sp. MPI-SDFR-AT-0127]
MKLIDGAFLAAPHGVGDFYFAVTIRRNTQTFGDGMIIQADISKEPSLLKLIDS